MRDRQLFVMRQLKNGISVYHYPSEEAYAALRLSIPFGAVHNTGAVLPGSASFLMHLMMQRSALYPQRNEFSKRLSYDAAQVNASAGYLGTVFELDGEAGSPWFGNLIRHVFSPSFGEEDIVRERARIVSQRAYEVWHPGDDELGQYLLTEWMTGMLSQREESGGDEDLEGFTPEYLYRVHRRYEDLRTTIVVVGGVAVQALCEILERIPVENQPTKRLKAVLSWVRPEYHEHAFEDLNTYDLYVGSILPEDITIEDRIAVHTILDYFLLPNTGFLHTWLRKERGWTYGAYWNPIGSGSTNNSGWRLCIPLTEKEWVPHVRNELRDRMRHAISDEAAIARGIRRLTFEKRLAPMRLSDIADGAIHSLARDGRVVSEAEESACIERCRDIAYLRKVLDRYFVSAQLGEFCAVPENCS
jgi:predicted Zn-dependent peptidase